MADPLSIASGAIAVITATKQTVTVIYKFIRDCKEARSDLTQITGELSELILILELIRDENTSATKDCLPNAVEAQVQAMLTSCTTTVHQIEKTLAIQKSITREIKNTAETIKNTTETTQDTTFEIKRDTNEILNEIYKLRGQLPPVSSSDPERHRLEQWLDNLTHYAETIVADEERSEILDADSLAGHTGALRESDDSLATSTQPPTSTSRQVPASTSKQRPMPTSSDECPTSSEGDNAIHAPKASREHFPKMKKLEGKKRSQGNCKPNQLPSPIIISSPCASEPVQSAYCAALDIWATLHEDLVLRLWSSRTGKLRASLPVLRDGHNDSDSNAVKLTESNSSIQFCPIMYELILVEVFRCRLEVWDWDNRVRIQTPETFTKDTKSWTHVVPQSTIIYVSTSDNYLKIVDLVAPSELRKISLAKAVGSTYDLMISKHRVEGVEFISEGEIFVLWKTPSPTLMGLFGHQLYRGWVIQLPVISTDELAGKASVSTRYSNAVISNSKVTARYTIPQGFISLSSVCPNGDKRWLRVSGTWWLRERKAGKGGSKLTMFGKIQILNLDTGVPLLEWNARWFYAVHPYKFAILGNPTYEGNIVICLEDGSELGRLPCGWHTSSDTDKIALARRAGSNIEFRMVDVDLEKPAR